VIAIEVADRSYVDTRTHAVMGGVAWRQERHQWPGWQGVAMVGGQRVIIIAPQMRFHTTSLVLARRPDRPDSPSRLDDREMLHRRRQTLSASIATMTSRGASLIAA
jgi:hypothetical protein